MATAKTPPPPPVPATAATAAPAVTEADFVAKDFRFSDGKTLPALKQHYRTTGTPVRNAKGEIEHCDAFDYVLVNEDLESTFEQLKAILTAERLKRERQPQLSAFVRSLTDQEKKLRERTAGTGIDVERQGDQLVLNMPGDVTFDLNSAMVKSQFRSALDNVASTLAEYPSTYIDVYGHTDSTGSDTYNQGLSERRAASVADYLAGRGIQRARMATMGYGETQLKCSPERGEADYQCNRRVEIRIAPVTQADVNAAN